MKRLAIIITFFAVGSFFATQAQAQTTTSTTARQVNQRARIAEGRQSGELTHREAAALNAQQRNIKRTKRRAKADGVVTRAERKEIRRKQNRASRSIRRQKNDAQDRN